MTAHPVQTAKVAVDVLFTCPHCDASGTYEPVDAGERFSERESAGFIAAHKAGGEPRCLHDYAFLYFDDWKAGGTRMSLVDVRSVADQFRENSERLTAEALGQFRVLLPKG